MNQPSFRIVLIALCLTCAAVLFGLWTSPSVDAQSASSGVRVLQSDTSRIVLELNVADYTTRVQRTTAGTFSEISIPGLGHTIEPDKPQLPTQSAMVAIPPGAQASLAIVVDDARTDALANPPLPEPTQRVNNDPRASLPSYAGSVITPDAATYSANQNYPAAAARITKTGDWRSQHFVVVEFNPAQYNPATRQLTFHRRLRVEITLTFPRGRTAQTLGGAVNEGAFETMMQQAIVNYNSARTWRTPRAITAPARAPRYSGGPWYKIAVNTDGMYKVTCQALQNAGVNNATLDPAQLQLFDAATELAINVVGSTWTTTCGTSNYFEFYGRADTSKYSITNIYWLTFGATSGKRMLTRDGGVAGSTPIVFTETLHLEENHLYKAGIPWEDSDHWHWSFIAANSSASFTFPINRLPAGTYSATLTMPMINDRGGTYTAALAMNGTVISNAVTWNNLQASLRFFTMSQASLLNGTNTLQITNTQGSGYMFLNWFEVAYNAEFKSVTDTLRFRQTGGGTWQYPITNFSNATLKAFDITDPYSVTVFNNLGVTGSGPYTLTFGDVVTSTREYWALTDAQSKTPASITSYTPANLSSSSNGATYLVISHNAFLSNVQPLVNLRAAQGFTTKLVDVQAVYDEFADGLPTPQAIRDFLATTLANWNPKPAYVLLVGDGHFDPLGNCVATACPAIGSTVAGTEFIPPFLKFADPWIGETASDNAFVAFNPVTNLPEMALGRLPVNNATEADAMVNKIIANETNPPNGAWRGMVTFLSDNSYDANGNTDSAGDFWGFSDEVASNPAVLPSIFARDRIYYNPCDPVAYPWCKLDNPPYQPYTTSVNAKTALLSSINSGRLILNYVGHGSVFNWGHEVFFTASDVASLTNAGKPMMVLEMTCYTGYFHFNNPALSSVAETNVRATNKGALATWAASGLGIATGHDYLDRGFMMSVMSPGFHDIGPGTVNGKSLLYTSGIALDLLDTYNLLGDPAARLAIPANLGNFYLPAIRK